MKEKCDDLEASLEQLKSELTELKALYKEKETEIANQEVQLRLNSLLRYSVISKV
jgi:hypothetical protein